MSSAVIWTDWASQLSNRDLSKGKDFDKPVGSERGVWTDRQVSQGVKTFIISIWSREEEEKKENICAVLDVIQRLHQRRKFTGTIQLSMNNKKKRFVACPPTFLDLLYGIASSEPHKLHPSLFHLIWRRMRTNSNPVSVSTDNAGSPSSMGQTLESAQVKLPYKLFQELEI